jgi:hypothetical protein
MPLTQDGWWRSTMFGHGWWMGAAGVHVGGRATYLLEGLVEQALCWARDVPASSL